MFQLLISTVITCQLIQKPEHGKVQCESELEFVYGASCLIRCNDGYEMDFPTHHKQQKIVCESNASFGIYSENPNDCKGMS